jgi:SulP family sulfate permease
VLTLRVDESLYFANARYLEDSLYDMVAAASEAQARGADVPGGQRDRHERAGIAGGDQRASASARRQFHLSEVKGPVMDRLRRGDFLHHLSGKVFLSQHQAALELAAKPSQGRITTSQPN